LTALALGVLAALVLLLLWGVGLLLEQLSSVLIPLGIAGVFAYLLDPLVDSFELRGVPRARAILCVFALAALILTGVVGSILPQIISETQQLTQRIPSYSDRLQQRLREWIEHPPAPLRGFLSRSLNKSPGESTGAATDNAASSQATNAAPPSEILTTNATSTAKPPHASTLLSQALAPETLESVTAWLAKTLPKIGYWLFGQASRVASWFGVLAGLFLIPIYAFYLLLEKHHIKRGWSDYLPVANPALKKELVFIVNSTNDCLIAFFRGQVLVALCDGILYTVGFFAIGLPYAFLIGAAAVALTMIPFLGAIIVCVSATVIAFVQFGDWVHPALVLGVTAVVQLLEGLVISPKIMGGRVGLHPLTIILAVMIGTTLLGNILGGLLAIPLTAAGRAILYRYLWKSSPAPSRHGEHVPTPLS
jgi:predicted PurR-regulated permease PerM